MENEPSVLQYESPSVVIAAFDDEGEARLAASRLASEGIDSDVKDKIPRRALGKRAAFLLVLSNDADAAVAILKQTPARKYLASPHAPPVSSDPLPDAPAVRDGTIATFILIVAVVLFAMWMLFQLIR